MSGDHNPIHLDGSEAQSYGYGRRVAHGVVSLMLLSRLIGMRLPGPGALWMKQQVDWHKPVFVGDELMMTAVVRRVSAGAGTLDLEVRATNQKGDIVMTGEATVKVSTKLASRQPQSADDRVALVVGGSRGIGAATARRLAGNGMTVAVNHRDSSRAAAEVVAEIEKAEGHARAFHGDVSTAGAALVEEVTAAFGRLDVIVHCATPPLRTIEVSKLDYRDIEAYLRTYLEGTLGTMRAAIPGMKQTGFGRLVVLGTSAMLSAAPPEGWTAYLTAKHALFGMVRSLACELGPLGITCNMVSPGLTVTELTESISQRAKEVEARRSPMRRLATPEDTAEVIAFLAGPAAGYLNGLNIPVTGGPAGGG
jgi:3-oxoacyl-[acyl-carrier protein] reductase